MTRAFIVNLDDTEVSDATAIADEIKAILISRGMEVISVAAWGNSIPKSGQSALDAFQQIKQIQPNT